MFSKSQSTRWYFRLSQHPRNNCSRSKSVQYLRVECRYSGGTVQYTYVLCIPYLCCVPSPKHKLVPYIILVLPCGVPKPKDEPISRRKTSRTCTDLPASPDRCAHVARYIYRGLCKRREGGDYEPLRVNPLSSYVALYHSVPGLPSSGANNFIVQLHAGAYTLYSRLLPLILGPCLPP